MTKKPKPSKDELKEALKRLGERGIEHILKKLPPRYAEGVEPVVTARPKRKRKAGAE